MNVYEEYLMIKESSAKKGAAGGAIVGGIGNATRRYLKTEKRNQNIRDNFRATHGRRMTYREKKYLLHNSKKDAARGAVTGAAGGAILGAGGGKGLEIATDIGAKALEKAKETKGKAVETVKQPVIEAKKKVKEKKYGAINKGLNIGVTLSKYAPLLM